MGVLRAFAGAFKLKIGEVEFGVSAEKGTADSGTLEHDLPELLAQVAATAAKAEGVLTLFVDEVQYLSADELSALIVAVHKLGQRSLPFILFGAGLPQLAALAGESKSYAERLFDYPEIGPLSPEAAKDAITAPLLRANRKIEPAALKAIVDKTSRYPYFLQEWGYQSWNAASSSPITSADVKLATKSAIERLDSGFFKVRFDRLTPRERDYMRAMAGLGAGPHRSGDIAAVLDKSVSAVGPVRDGLIKKGMIYSPRHGDTAFTVPLFDEFLKRAMK